MNCKVTAIYENGVLRLTTPLDLPERSQVHITVHDVSPAATQSGRPWQVRQALVAAGLSLAASTGENYAKRSGLLPERREELARRFSDIKPISELISEDREGR